MNCSNLSLFLTSCRRERWKSKATVNSFHLHSFLSFSDNPLSNDFAVRQQFPIGDAFYKFAFQSRTNLLPTPEFIEIIENRQHSVCQSCLRDGRALNLSLAHILNGCRGRYVQYTQRHNDVQKIIVDYMKKLLCIEEIYTDKSLHLTNMPDDIRRLRPDVVAWANNRSKCYIVEVSVPYACQSFGNNSLMTVYQHKKEKYRPLINFIQRLNIQVQLFVIVVSSLGAVHHDTITDINRLFPIRKVNSTIIKRVSRAALTGSMKIWLSCHHQDSGPLSDSSGSLPSSQAPDPNGTESINYSDDSSNDDLEH